MFIEKVEQVYFMEKKKSIKELIIKTFVHVTICKWLTMLSNKFEDFF